MTSQSYIVTGHAREQLDELLAAGKDVRLIESFGGGIERVVDITPPDPTVSNIDAELDPTEDTAPPDQVLAMRSRLWAMRDYPPPTEGLVAILCAAIVSWENEAAADLNSIDAATTFRACAWELRQILKEVPDQTTQTTKKEQTR
ncbi:hypothetical protein [Rhodococcus aetherivorans]|uniref:hypothetical protein n=1 Tax=Rhodococcus aetherivorans TaxID=191292 RepID=UPI00388EE6E0